MLYVAAVVPTQRQSPLCPGGSDLQVGATVIFQKPVQTLLEKSRKIIVAPIMLINHIGIEIGPKNTFNTRLKITLRLRDFSEIYSKICTIATFFNLSYYELY